MILRLKNQQLTMLKREALRAHPVEACALLFGKLTEKEAVVERVIMTTNILQSTTSFEIDSKEFYDAFTRADKEGLEFLGFFHSHPAPVNPSSIDLRYMRLWSDAVWLIFSSVDKKFGAYQMKDGKVHPLTLKKEGKL